MIGGHDLNNALLVHFRAVANETGAFFFLINGKFHFVVFCIFLSYVVVQQERRFLDSNFVAVFVLQVQK